jgi:hypothetical protein
VSPNKNGRRGPTFPRWPRSRFAATIGRDTTLETANRRCPHHQRDSSSCSVRGCGNQPPTLVCRHRALSRPAVPICSTTVRPVLLQSPRNCRVVRRSHGFHRRRFRFRRYDHGTSGEDACSADRVLVEPLTGTALGRSQRPPYDATAHFHFPDPWRRLLPERLAASFRNIR